MVHDPSQDIGNLPVDMWETILSFMDPSTLATLSYVSKGFYKLANSEIIWLRLVRQQDIFTDLTAITLNWKDRYRSRFAMLIAESQHCFSAPCPSHSTVEALLRDDGAGHPVVQKSIPVIEQCFRQMHGMTNTFKADLEKISRKELLEYGQNARTLPQFLLFCFLLSNYEMAFGWPASSESEALMVQLEKVCLGVVSYWVALFDNAPKGASFLRSVSCSSRARSGCGQRGTVDGAERGDQRYVALS